MKAEFIELWVAGKIEDMQLEIGAICPRTSLDNGAQAFKMPSSSDCVKLSMLQSQINILKELQDFCETLSEDYPHPERSLANATRGDAIQYGHDDPRYQDSLWEK